MAKSDFAAEDPDQLRSFIAPEAETLGLTLDERVVTRLADFGRLFLEWNARINLAAATSPANLVGRHFVDSFAASRFVPTSARVVDVGSGGGLPALPLALIREDISVACYEPIHKKGAFLRTAVRELGLGGRVSIEGQSIGMPADPALQGQADLAMSRATLDPATWLTLGLQLVRPGSGRVLVYATGHSEGALPPPARSFEYGRNRRLMLFERS